MYGDNGKYIIVQHGSLEEPIIFSQTVSHDEMARKVHAEVVSQAGSRAEPGCGDHPVLDAP